MDGCRKPICGERSRQEIAVVNLELDVSAGILVEIGMRGSEGPRLGRRRVAKPVDIEMAVALGVGDADESAEREILLHGESGLAGQVLSGHEVVFTARTPLRSACRIDDRLVEALAGLRGN